MQARLLLKLQPQVRLQQVISSALLAASGAELEELIADELAANPALERTGDRDSWQRRQAHPDAPVAGSPATEHAIDPELRRTRTRPGREPGAAQAGQQIAAVPTVHERLASQLALLAAGDEFTLALRMLQLLDGHGYLRATSAELAVELGTEIAATERAVQLVQELEPPGVGARDLRECLLLQCAHLAAALCPADAELCAVTRRMLEEAWDEFAAQKWKALGRKLRVDAATVQAVRRFIARNFYPYPLGLIEAGGAPSMPVQPDVIIRRAGRAGDCRFMVEIPESERFSLALSSAFAHALHARRGSVPGSVPGGVHSLGADDAAWVNLHVCRARLFLAALRRRWATLRLICEYLATYQAEFFAQGPRGLKPLTRATVAAALGLHESTVSRAIREKFVQLPDRRLMPLADFFDNSLAAKAAIRELLAVQSCGMSDREIVAALDAQGFRLARRTVAKYREQLNLPAGGQKRRADMTFPAF